MSAEDQERRLWRRVWRTVHEPRVKTSTAIVAYMVTIVDGVTQMSDRWALLGWFALIPAAFLVIGAGVGIPSAWTGRQWVETVGAWMVIVGLISHVVLSASAALAALYFVTRFVDVRRRPYARGRGPQTPLDEARDREVRARESMERAAREQG